MAVSVFADHMQVQKSLQEVLDRAQRPALISLCKAYAMTPTSVLYVNMEIMPFHILVMHSRQFCTTCAEENPPNGEKLNLS